MQDAWVELVAASGVSRPSPVAVELLRLLSTDSYDRIAVVRLVRRDPDMVTNLLRVASMADVAVTDGLPSIDGAIAVLGETRVRRLVVNQALSALRVERLAGYGLKDEAFWRMSVSTAHVAEELARRVNLDPGAMYVVGLLLDLGKVALDHAVDPGSAWSPREALEPRSSVTRARTMRSWAP